MFERTSGDTPKTPVDTADVRVRQITPPPDIARWSMLGRTDYEDAFVVDVASPQARSAEQWIRSMLEDAPQSMRRQLLWGWTTLGLKVNYTRSPETVLGWSIRANEPDYILLGASSRVGMPGELFLRREEQGLLFATLVRQNNPAVRALWATVEATHVRTVTALLQDLARRAVS